MPPERPAGHGEAARRSVVPHSALRSLWLSAAWTGVGAAFVCAVVAIVVVATCWLPAAGSSGHGGAAIRAGLLTFLAALHGGITVDGVAASFVPLGLTLAVACVAWRAGCGLADAAAELDEDEPARLLAALALQTGVFGAVCGVVAAGASLGTSHVAVLGAVAAGALLWLLAAGAAFVRESPLAAEVSSRCGAGPRRALRAGVLASAVYLGAGALLAAASLVVHHGEAEALSRQVGGGWGGVPVLLLGILAAPNAAIAGAGYLAGPGFALGSDVSVSLGSGAHGTLPAFPLLAAAPTGASPNAAVWVLVALTPLAAGGCVAAVAGRERGFVLRLADTAGGAAVAGVIGALAAWLAGGAIGDAGLATIGVSPWRFGLVTAGGTAAVAVVVLGILALFRLPAAARAAERLGSLAARHASEADVAYDGLDNDRDEPPGPLPADEDDERLVDWTADTMRLPRVRDDGDPEPAQDGPERGQLAG